MYQHLDGPSKQGPSKSVDDITPEEIKSGASALDERRVITVQPLGGKIWVYFGAEGVNPSAATVKNDGFEQPNKSLRSYEVGPRQPFWVVADSGTVSVRFAERA